MECLDEQTLLDFLAGRLDGAATKRAREHVAQCEACNAIATELIVDAAAHVKTTPAKAASYELAPGAVLVEKYRLLRPLGEGGMGVVWEAETLGATDIHVAVKLLKAFDAAAKKRFLREIATTSRITDPGLVRVVAVIEDVEAGCPALVLELLPGQSLVARLATGAKLSLGETLVVGRHLAKTLAAVHEAGLVHRDVKPANVFLTGDAARPVVLLDLGLAKSILESTTTTKLTRTGHSVGTPAYMAPEQLAGEQDVDARADLWAIGVVLYECLTGTKPFVGRTAAEILLETAKGPSVSIEGEIGALVRRLLASDRKGRPASATEILDVLARIDPSS